MSDYFGVSPEGYQKPLYLANNLSDVVDKSAARTNLGVASADDVLKAANPIGTIISFYGSVAPYGYLPCSGQTVSSTTFPSLVTFLGGTTSAVLPDLRGEFLRGWDNGRGVDLARAIGTLQLDGFQGFRMETMRTLSGTAWGNDDGGAGAPAPGPPLGTVAPGTRPRNLTGAFVTDGVNGTPRVGSETRPRNISVLYCIKAYDTPVSATQLNLTSLINEFQLGRSVTSFVNLKSSATGLSSLVSTTADEITLKTASTQYRTFTNLAVSINTAIVGLNGLDTGTLAVSTWYSTWVISDGINVAGLISASATNPVLPTGYTYKARTGWIRTDSNATNKFPLGFIQIGRIFQYDPRSGSNIVDLPQLGSTAATLGVTAVSVLTSVPTTAASIEVVLRANAVSQPLAGVAIPRATSQNLAVGIIVPAGADGNSKGSILLAESGIYWSIAITGTGTAKLFCAGFEDNL